jgi:head-tail adaptor
MTAELLTRSGAGRLDQRIAFDMRIEIDDGYGNTVGEFQEQFDCAAELVWHRGGEAVIAARLDSRQPVTIRIRKSSATMTIKPAWRARNVRTADEFQIRTVNPDNSRAMIELFCEAGVAS